MYCCKEVAVVGGSRRYSILPVIIGAVLPLLSACQTFVSDSPPPLERGIDAAAMVNDSHLLVPPITAALPLLPNPAAVNRARHYSVVVQKVPVDEVLFALARDSSFDLDITGDIAGYVTLKAIRQPLRALLEQIAGQVPIQYSIVGKVIRVRADTPVVQSYRVDYLNIARSATSRVDLATQVGSLSSGIETARSVGSNGSQMSIENSSENRFWRSLIGNIAGILGEPYRFDDDAGKASDGNIFVHRESGLITVRATSMQHRDIRGLIDRVVASAQRQVLIEATVVEVTLSKSSETGVDWRILETAGSATAGFTQVFSGSADAADVTTVPSGVISYRNGSTRIGDVSGTLKLLQQFGDVKVLSSPKIIALNNQPAVLKVVDNRVYFTFDVDRTQKENGDESTIVQSTLHSVPVGLVMNVTPFINHGGEVILNVRPTISRILNFAEDPSPALAGQSEVRNLIPEIQVREMESLLRVNSGEVAIIGGLMQNRVDNRNTGLPGLSRIPLLGKVFAQDVKQLEKTELLVFLRPTVMRSSGVVSNRQRPGRNLPAGADHLLREPAASEGLLAESSRLQ